MMTYFSILSERREKYDETTPLHQPTEQSVDELTSAVWHSDCLMILNYFPFGSGGTHFRQTVKSSQQTGDFANEESPLFGFDSLDSATSCAQIYCNLRLLVTLMNHKSFKNGIHRVFNLTAGIFPFAQMMESLCQMPVMKISWSNWINLICCPIRCDSTPQRLLLCIWRCILYIRLNI